MSSPSLSALSMSIKVSVTGSGQVNVIGDDYSPLKQSLSFNKSVGPFTKANANTASLGADECYSAITVVASSASADVNLQSLTDILMQSGVIAARVKGYVVRLLSATDDPDNGTACTGVSVNAPLPAPVLAAPVPSTTGGTLAAGTYYYKVTSLTAAGESVGSNEGSATTTGTTSDVSLSWGGVAGATGYKVYRGTASGAETLLATVGSGSTTTYTDTGAAAGSGSPPLVNTAYPANLATLPGLTNVTLGNGEVIAWATPGATGVAVTGTTNDLHIVNNDAAHSAAVQITLIIGTT